MGREELRAALEELTASLAAGHDPLEDLGLPLDPVDPRDPAASEEQAARLELLEELRGL